MMKKKLPLLLAIVIVVVACVAGTTMAYLTSSMKIVNTFLTPSLSTTIYENNEVATGKIQVSEGSCSTTKQVQIKNEASGLQPDTAIDAFIRAMVIPRCPTGGNVSYDLANDKIVLTVAKNKKVELILAADWRDHWFFNDNMFYHKTRVAPNAITSILLDTVQVSSIDLWKDLSIDVLSEGVQAEGGAAPQVWGVTINADGTITK